MRGKSWQIFLLVLLFSMLIFRGLGSSQEKVMAQWVGVSTSPGPPQVTIANPPDPTIMVDPDCPPGYGCQSGFYCCSGGDCCPIGDPPPTGDPGQLVNGACGSAHYGCSAGALGSTAEYSTQWQWWCNGTNGGTNILCSELKPTCSFTSGATSVYTNTSTQYCINASNAPDGAEIWKSITSSENWVTPPVRARSAPGCSNTSFDEARTYYVVCNAYGTADNPKCSGNPFGLPAGWIDCGSNDALTVNVIAAPLPTCNISASPTSINYYTASTISWSSTNATSCSITSPGWTGTSGSQSTGNLTSTTTYTCSCSGAGGTGTDSATVTVGPPPSLPIGTCGSFNDLTCTTPITWTWANGPGLQATFDYAPETNPLAQYWLFNSPTASPKTFNSILTGHTAYARTTYDYSYFSSTANKTCTIPTLSAPTLTCGSFNEAGVYTPVTATWANGTALQVTRDYAPSTLPADQYWMYNDVASSGIVITPPAGKYMPPGHTIYARTYYDCGGSTFSATSSKTCDIPDLPPATIQGDLQQKSGTACYTASAPDHTFYISSISSTTSNGCVTSVCKADPGNVLPNATATDYNCAITFDEATCLNQAPPTWPTSVTINLTGATTTNPGFSFIGWTDPPGTCQTAPTNSVLVAAGSSTTRNLTFNFGGGNWLKAKDTSFNPSSTSGTTVVSIPMWANPFPASSDTGSPYFIIGQAGSALGVGVSPNTAYSTPNNWNDSSYSHTPAMNAANFINYVKSRKNYQPISDLTAITADGVYLWTGGTLTISDLTKFNQFKVVLMSNGEIIINKEPFSPTKSLTVIANIITFNNSVYKANGIFIANTINTGTASQGLQIVGNLNALYTFNNNRSWSDTSIPSIFVEFDPAQYINLLPYLSTASYDWRQIQ